MSRDTLLEGEDEAETSCIGTIGCGGIAGDASSRSGRTGTFPIVALCPSTTDGCVAVERADGLSDVTGNICRVRGGYLVRRAGEGFA